jgi:hypothetical protein
MDVSEGIRIEISQASEGWHVGVVRPGEETSTSYGPYRDLEAAKEVAAGMAQRLAEEGNPIPPVILLKGALWSPDG